MKSIENSRTWDAITSAIERIIGKNIETKEDKDIIKEFSLVIQSNINVIRTSSIGFVNNTLNLILMLKGNNNAGISVVKLL